MSKKSDPRPGRWLRRAITLANVGVACITLAVGLWPFAFHVRNGASWSSDPVGLHFGQFATAIGESPFDGTETCQSKDSPFTLELWIETERASGYGTILAFDSDEHPESLSIRQSIGDIEFLRSFQSGDGKTGLGHFYIDDVFSGRQRRFLTLAVDDRGTRVFVDGKRIERIHDLGIRCGDLQGTLILGTAPSSNDTWSGTFVGLAAYGRALDAEQAKAHYQEWAARPADLKQLLNANVLYVFDEGAGRTVHSRSFDRWDITIPKNYSVRRKRFLQPFWEEFSWDRTYAVDLVINVVGFIPLGFCLAAFLAIVLRRDHHLAITVLLCFATSLIIEVLQAFMPIRYSGTTDLITNTCGGMIGASLYQLLTKHFLRRQLESTQTLPRE